MKTAIINEERSSLTPTHIALLGFDSIHSAGLISLISSKDTTLHIESFSQNELPSFSLSLGDQSQVIAYIAKHNFKEIVHALSLLTSEQRPPLIVTNLHSLALLGLNQSDFPTGSRFLRGADLVEGITQWDHTNSQECDSVSIADGSDLFSRLGLSGDQLRLFIRIVQGDTNAEIAKVLVLSEKGVESAIKRLAIKVDCVRTAPEQQNLRVLLGRRYAQLLGIL